VGYGSVVRLMAADPSGLRSLVARTAKLLVNLLLVRILQVLLQLIGRICKKSLLLSCLLVYAQVSHTCY
jgi:hypothetical protein